MQPSLYLASASPRRAELLKTLGLDFTQGGVDVDETPGDDEPPDAMVVRLAVKKARAADAVGVVIAADTAVVLGERVFGKPRDRADALGMLRALSGRVHRVMTGVAVRQGESVQTVLSVSDVAFREIDDDEAARYWQSGEPGDKAGGYAIQGLGGVFVERLSGSYSGVVGLPVFETAALLRAAGIEILR